jgi:hypothetical protein
MLGAHIVALYKEAPPGLPGIAAGLGWLVLDEDLAPVVSPSFIAEYFKYCLIIKLAVYPSISMARAGLKVKNTAGWGRYPYLTGITLHQVIVGDYLRGIFNYRYRNVAKEMKMILDFVYFVGVGEYAHVRITGHAN